MTDIRTVPSSSYSAFLGDHLIASGDLLEVALSAKKVLDQGEPDSLLVFDDLTSEMVEIDLRGAAQDVASRIRDACLGAEAVQNTQQGPGRPKLGVVGREVTLLPRHWDWLDAQPGGASVTLRKLVEAAKRANAGQEQFRMAQEATYRFMRDMAGDRPGFEEAIRVLFSSKNRRLELFEPLVACWPKDIRKHVLELFKRTLKLEKAQSKPIPKGHS